MPGLNNDEPQKPSDEPGGDVSPTAIQICPSSKQSSSLKIESETVAKSPTDRQRRIIGVGERVNLTAIDSSGSVQWTLTGNGHLSESEGATTLFTADDTEETVVVTATDSTGVRRLSFRSSRPTTFILKR